MKHHIHVNKQSKGKPENKDRFMVFPVFTSTNKVEFEKRIVKQPSGCWEWQAYINVDGYGCFTISRKHKGMLAHRVSWTMLKADIPKGMCVLHKCDNRKCVNPAHLFLGTKLDNMLDKIAKGRGNINKKHPAANGIYKTQSNKYKATLTIDSKSLTIGVFQTEQDAICFRSNYIQEQGYKVIGNTVVSSDYKLQTL